MTFKSKALSGQNAKLLLIGDSLTVGVPFRYSYKVATKLAARFPLSTVKFKVRNPGAADTITTIQTGSNGQTLTVISDAVSGATSYRTDQRSTIYDTEAVDSATVFLGINDVVNFDASPSVYNTATYYLNMKALVLYGQQTGYELAVITPAWGDAYGSLELKFAGISWIARRLAIALGVKCIDARKMCEDHFANNGSGGLGVSPDNWSDGDDIHLNEAFHTALAEKIIVEYLV